MKTDLPRPAMEQNGATQAPVREPMQPRANAVEAERPMLPLISKIRQALAEEEINYCHWKSNNVLHRSASGENDLDLLIDRADAARFTQLLFRLGFKAARAPEEKQSLGVLDYFGYDENVDKWVHVHAHYQLILGHDTTKNLRIPLEEAYLASAVAGGDFRIPAVEFEFILFVIRMMLKHATWDTVMGGEGRLGRGEWEELAYLQARVQQDRLSEILRCHLPQVDAALFRRCIEALQPGCSAWKRIKAGQELQGRLQANSVYPLLAEPFLKMWRRTGSLIQRRLFRSRPKYRLETGGALIAIVGGDGAGKSAAVDELRAWAKKTFHVRSVHMGKPPLSGTTIFLRSILKMGQLLGLYPLEASLEETIGQKSLVSPGYPYLIREVCRARDRYRTYVRARRYAAQGGLVILDRFPLARIRIMDGAQAEQFIRRVRGQPQASHQFLSPRLESRFARFLIKREESYYARIMLPDVLIVLRVDPQTAVSRKPGEDALAVQKRTSEIWKENWQDSSAFVVDANRSKAEVARELKRLIWSQL